MGKLNKINLFYSLIFTLGVIIGLILFINRYVINFLPSMNIITLLDHLIAGFITPLGFFILYLGIGSFFHPNRKVIYRKKWFIILTGLALIVPFMWDGVIQHLKDVDQIFAELVGIALSWVYFLTFRSIKLKQLKTPNPKH
jgi:quinol-cytochrome oxidoreductase complex cytochrome b subunit